MTVYKHAPLGLIVSLFALAGFGCAEEQLTDLDRSKEWGELSTEEQAEFCEDAQDYVLETVSLQGWIDVWCLGQSQAFANAVFSGDQEQSAASCQIHWEECRDEFRPSIIDFCPTVFPGDTCSATVGEFADCSVDVYAQFEELTAMRCSDLTFGEGEGLPLDTSCYEPLRETCEG